MEIRTDESRRRWFAGIVAGIGGAAILTSVVGFACIVHEANDITFNSVGYDWCVEADGAQGWNNSNGTGKIDILPTPIGCKCFSKCNDEDLTLWDADPPGPLEQGYSEHQEYLADVRALALDECNDAAAGYIYNNCPTVTSTAVVFRKASPGADPDCTYNLDDGGTGGGDVCASQAPQNPGSYIDCQAQGNCDVDQELVDDLWVAPVAGANESAYAVFSTGTIAGLKLQRVASTDIVYLIGLRTNDIVTHVNGDPLATSAQVWSAMLEHFAATSFNITVRRGTSTLTYHYDVV